MAETNINSSDYGDMNTYVEDFEVGALNTEGVNDSNETEYLNPNFTRWYGYYQQIAELKAAINAKATWTVGKGFEADAGTTVQLDRITGNGTDTFDSILKNMIIISNVNGDAYAEIIRNDKGILINLKPLDPSSMTTVFNREGIIKRYEQRNKVGDKVFKKGFTPNEIFHLTKDRVADNIHGTSIVETVEWVVLALNEALADQKKLMHRNVVPRIVWKLDTDNTVKINKFKKMADKAVQNAENIFIPMGAAEHEVLSVPPNSTLNPLPWIEFLNNQFWKAVRIPQIIVGGSQEFTEATAKIAYLAFQQNVEEEQRDIEDNLWSQLAIKLDLLFPASLENELLSDEKKDKTQGITKPNEMQPTMQQE